MPFVFDAAAAAREALDLPPAAWERHFNSDYYVGDWSGAALRSSGGSVALYAEPQGAAAFSDTPFMRTCPSIAAQLSVFKCPLNSVRLLRLGPGARVREHRDYGLELSTGEARLHVPIVSAGGAHFILNAKPVPMRPGECWYVDVNSPHSVCNEGSAPRIHLVIDCIADDWLKGMLRDAASRD